MNPLRHFVAAGLFLAGIAVAAGADLTHTIQGLQITNYTGYVIDSDIAGPQNREHILVQSRVRTTNSSANAVLTEYYLRYRLLNSAGQPHPLYDSSGVLSLNQTFNLTNSFGIGAGATVNRTNVAALRPAARLNPYDQYTVELRVFTPGALREADLLTNSPQTFYHFTNLVSNDPALNVIASVNHAEFSRAYAVQSDQDKNSFLAEVEYTLRRYDAFSGANAQDSVSVTLNYQLVNATTGVPVPLVAEATNFTRQLFRYNAPLDPVALTGVRTVVVKPAPGVQLNSVDGEYRLVVAISHLEQTGVPGSLRAGNTIPSADTQLLHFNGTLLFGSVAAVFTSIDNDPAAGATAAGSHVSSILGVDNQSGTIPIFPGATFGDGTDLNVRLLPDGVAVSEDQVSLKLPPGGDMTVNGVRMALLAPAALSTNGFIGSVRVYLPTGMGFRENISGHILHNSFVVNNVALGSDLEPLGDVTFNPPLPVRVVEETKPLWIGAASIVWRVAQGRFEINIAGGVPVEHVRSDEYAALEAQHAVLDNSQRSLKRSNDRFYEAAQSISSPALVVPDSNSVARLTFNLTFGPGDFRAHFPYDAGIEWTGNGSLQVLLDQVVSAGSQLDGAGMVGVTYGTGCTGIDCGDGASTRIMRLEPTDGTLRFTRDGGLVAGGLLDAPHRLQWGYISSLGAYAHEAFYFSDANFLMPGHFLRGDQSELPVLHRASVILYTGVASTNATYLERPDMPGTSSQVRYAQGFADYAGMNVAVGVDGAHQGQSTLAGTSTGTNQLKGVSKYYARRGGVSGIHDVVFNTFPPSLTLYGYTFDFSRFGLNFIENRMRDSHIDGLIDVPFPSQFQQEFAGLRLNCLGGIETAPMPKPQENKALAYWNGQFDSLALQFKRVPEEICNVTNAFLTLGVRTEVAHVREVLYGTLGFRPDGNLIPRAAGLDEIDSRLKLPNVIRVAGPGTNESYVLNPVLDVYFNGYDQLGTETNNVGWVNIAATMDVPFFEDLQIHVQTSATGGNSNAPIYMLGGWPTNGWESAPGVNFFTTGYFDDVNRGYAVGTAPDLYRDSGTDWYHPRARRTWLNVIPFDYPLTWSSVTRDFRSREPKVRNLMVLSTENELKYLSAANAEITFGAQFDGLPQLNLANIAFKVIDAATAAGNDAVANLLVNAVGGFGKLDEMLSANLDPFFDGIFDETVQGKIDQFYDRILIAYTNNPGGWKEGVGLIADQTFKTDSDSVSNRLVNLVGISAGQPGILKRLTNHLSQAEHGVAQIQQIIAEDPDGNRTIASELMRMLVQNVALQFAAGFLDEFVQPILTEADPTLDQISLVLTNLQTALSLVRANVADPVAGMRGELDGLFDQFRPELDATIAPIVNGVGDFVLGIDLALDSPAADFTPEEFKQIVRREIEDSFYDTPVAAGIQAIHKHRLYDVDAAIRQATDTAFQELNNVIRAVISETAEELNSSFTQLIAPLDNIAAAAKINGYAHINGDSLKEARVDVHARIELGTALEFNGYLQIKELDSTGTAGCGYAGTDSVTEVTLGAQDVQVGWISPELRASVGTKFTFDDGADSFPLRGLGGSFELTGKLDYEAFAINFLGASIALGQDENFLSGAAGMRVNKYDVFGGIYFGRACSIDPITLWDPEAGSLLGNGSFTGIYAYGEGWIPINELIGIPASCLFNISAGLGMGAGVFLEGPTFVAKMKAGVSGEALCMVGIKGELTGTGVLEGLDLNVLDGLTVKAKGTVGGKFGPCPFCLELEQSVALTFKQGKWKLDF